jgi:hypothetical protein
MDLFSDRFESPIGLILLITDGEALRALNFLDFESRMVRLLKLLRLPQPVREGLETLRIKRRLQAYFSGNLTSLADIPVRTEGTPFTQDSAGNNDHVWPTRPTHQAVNREPRRGIGERLQFDCHCRALPSRHRFRRRTHWLRRRS